MSKLPSQSPVSSYTIDGGPALDQLIEHHLQFITQRLQQQLGDAPAWSLVLGGSYGRGEGGVLLDQLDQVDRAKAQPKAQPKAQQAKPYNDYDLVIIYHHRSRRSLMKVLQQVSQEASVYCGIHVDITPISRRRLPHLPQALTWYELGQGIVSYTVRKYPRAPATTLACRGRCVRMGPVVTQPRMRYFIRPVAIAPRN